MESEGFAAFTFVPREAEKRPDSKNKSRREKYIPTVLGHKLSHRCAGVARLLDVQEPKSR